MRFGGPARGAGRQDRAHPRAGCDLHRRDRLRLHVRPEAPRGDQARGPGAQGDRGADDLQLPGTADQPRRGQAPSCSASDRTYQETIAEALIGLGCERALVVSADDGMDEISINSTTRVIEVADGRTEEWFVEAPDLGLQAAPIEAVAGAEPADNARIAESVLAGEAGPPLDLALLNGGAAILVGGGAEDLSGGVEKARESIGSGAAKGVLDKLVSRTGELAG